MNTQTPYTLPIEVGDYLGGCINQTIAEIGKGVIREKNETAMIPVRFSNKTYGILYCFGPACVTLFEGPLRTMPVLFETDSRSRWYAELPLLNGARDMAIFTEDPMDNNAFDESCQMFHSPVCH